MQSWYCPPVPVLPGRGPQLRLYDSADRQVRPVAPGSKATMYVCGITPYDATHLGHAATYVTFDLIHRLWLDLGHELHYVQNITDIDDPLFERADRDGVDWRDLAQAEVALFCEDMAALRVLPPQDYVGATEAIAEMVELIEKMLACGAAYVIDREMGEYQDIYFRADATLQFGYESGYDRDTMLRLCEERGGDPRRPGKSDELDALLWPVFWRCHGPRNSRIPHTRPFRRRDCWPARKPHVLPTGGARLPGGVGGPGEAAGCGARRAHRSAAVRG